MLNVLLVDDCADTVSVMTRLLQRRGHSVRSALTATSALTQLSPTPDLVLLDCGLPDLHGVELLRRLQQHGVQAMFVMLTGESRVDERTSAFEAGCDHYLIKPVGRGELERVLALAEGRLSAKSG